MGTVTYKNQPGIEKTKGNVPPGTSSLYYFEASTERAWNYNTPPQINWLASIAIRRTAWEARKFESSISGADYKFQMHLPKEAKLDLKDPALVIAAVHPANACKKALGSEYRPVPWETVKGLLG